MVSTTTASSGFGRRRHSTQIDVCYGRPVDFARTLEQVASFLEADIEHLLGQPGVQLTSVRHYFEAAGLLRWFDELSRQG